MQEDGCPHAKMFQSWAEVEAKEYASEELKIERMKVWVDNHRK
jgi:hypothetical protein